MAPPGTSLVHDSAHLHVSGQASYVDDLPEPAGTLHAALGLSELAHARLVRLDLDAVRRAPGVVAVLAGSDLVHGKFGPVLADEDILVRDTVSFHGQPLFAVAASTRAAARAAVRLARVELEPLAAVIGLEAAREQGLHVLPPVQLARGDIDDVLATAPHRLAGTLRQGGQEHFYLEGQITLAEPRDDNCWHLWCSTQHPTEMQHLVAHALGVAVHRVGVECRRMGGAFGGKESQSAQWAIIAALLARASGRPVKLRLDRDEDMRATGKRHDFHSRWEAGFDDSGLILGLRVELASRCGHSADLSGPVNDRALCHVDNAYFLDTVQIRSLRLRTHTVSNTAFRGFGGPQGMLVIETVIEDIARMLGLDPLDVRRRNFYAAEAGHGRDLTPYGMQVEDCIIGDLCARLEAQSDYRRRRAAIDVFNAGNAMIRRGIALTPLKFGISFNATLYNQAGALVHVYTDGSVLVSHGGTEMGQGLYTKIRQIAAHEFGIAPDRVRLSATDTTRVPNTSATAASSGTDLNGKAVQAACRSILARLAGVMARSHGGDAGDVRFHGGRVTLAGDPARSEDFADLVMRAYRQRVQLWDSGFYATPKIHFDPVTRTGRPFYYFAYGAACSEVAVDLATGATRLLQVDILHDAGCSLNPAIDIGQIEGGFVQGMGWLTSEELWWREDGRLMTHAPSTYKIPTATDVPARFNVALYDAPNREDSIHRSKAVGEPPLMLAFSVFFAIRAALASALPARQQVCLDAPASPEAVLRALGVLEAP
ncbi:MAG: xanthine dehydrogenase molybdopterin binding subunit [Pseudomonadota bacterium]|nr:xanthine dehydrogenase molybdopterin binding subunit [Pseudomonadota bacterium]